MTKDFFEKLLSFGSEWKVERGEVNEAAEVNIYLKWDLKEHKKPHAEQFEFIHDYIDYGSWRHLDIMQFKTFIYAKIPLINHNDGKIERVKTPWASLENRHTFLFEILAKDWLLATKNQTKTTKMLRCGFNVFNRIIHTASQRGVERRDENKVYKQLSVDEKSFQKGHSYVTVLSNPEN